MPLAYFLNAPTAKVGKSARRNLRFLHFRARYTLYGIVGACRTFTQDFLFRFDKKDRLCSSAAAADQYAEKHHWFYRAAG